jgi:hypothetical protein
VAFQQDAEVIPVALRKITAVYLFITFRHDPHLALQKDYHETVLYIIGEYPQNINTINQPSEKGWRRESRVSFHFKIAKYP